MDVSISLRDGGIRCEFHRSDGDSVVLCLSRVDASSLIRSLNYFVALSVIGTRVGGDDDTLLDALTEEEELVLSGRVGVKGGGGWEE